MASVVVLTNSTLAMVPYVGIHKLTNSDGLLLLYADITEQ